MQWRLFYPPKTPPPGGVSKNEPAWRHRHAAGSSTPNHKMPPARPGASGAEKGSDGQNIPARRQALHRRLWLGSEVAGAGALSLSMRNTSDAGSAATRRPAKAA
jgi:hypothetical protein